MVTPKTIFFETTKNALDDDLNDEFKAFKHKSSKMLLSDVAKLKRAQFSTSKVTGKSNINEFEVNDC